MDDNDFEESNFVKKGQRSLLYFFSDSYDLKLAKGIQSSLKAKPKKPKFKCYNMSSVCIGAEADEEVSSRLCHLYSEWLNFDVERKENCFFVYPKLWTLFQNT